MKLFQWVTVSLAIHIAIYFLFKEARPELPRSTDIEVIYKDSPSTNKQRQVVVSPEQKLKQKLEKLKNKAKLLSKETQRYTEQQLARKTGKTQNQAQRQALKRAEDLNKLLPELKKQLGKGLVQEPSTAQTRPQFKFQDESTTFDHIPHIKRGGFTALDADQFVFYTFYARTSQQIGSRWANNVMNYANKVKILDLYRLAKYPSNTYLEIIIDKNGHFVKSIVHKSSGDKGLDEAAINAFVQASPLNNPPEEMLSEDGLIHLRYSFHIEWDPRMFARRYK